MQVVSTHFVLEIDKSMGQVSKSIKKVFKLERNDYVMGKSNRANTYEQVSPEKFREMEQNYIDEFHEEDEFVSEIAKELINELAEGLAEFGEYDFYDKGVDYAVDTLYWKEKFTELNTEALVGVFQYCLDTLDEQKGNHLVEHFIGASDDRSDFKEILLADERFKDMY